MFADLVKKCVARHCECCLYVNFAVLTGRTSRTTDGVAKYTLHALVTTIFGNAFQLVRAPVIEGVRRSPRKLTRVQRCVGNEWFEAAAKVVSTRHRSVYQNGEVRVVGKWKHLGELLGINIGGKPPTVKTRIRRHRHHLASVVVHHHHRTRWCFVVIDFFVLRVGNPFGQHHLRSLVALSHHQLRLQRLFGKLLQAKINRQLQVATRLGFHPLYDAFDAPHGVDLITHIARNATQVNFVGEFNAVQPDALIGVITKRLVIFRRTGLNGTKKPNHMAADRTVLINAPPILFDDHTRIVLNAFHQKCSLLFGDIECQRHLRELVIPLVVSSGIQTLNWRIQRPRQTLKHLQAILRVVDDSPIDGSHQHTLVIRHHTAIYVKDSTTLRNQLHHA